MNLTQKCGVLFLLGLVVDLVQTIHIQACAHSDLPASVLTIIAVYVLGFWGHDWFVEHKGKAARWLLTLSAAFGAGLGTGIVILFGGYFG